MLRVGVLLTMLAVLIYFTDAKYEVEEMAEKEQPEEELLLRELEQLLDLRKAGLFNSLGLFKSGKPATEDEVMLPEEVEQMENDNIFGDDGPEPLKEMFKRIGQEWEKLIRLHNPDSLANKYTEDCVHILRRNGKTEVLVGREGTRDLYRRWFKDYGIYSLEVDRESVKGGRLGSEHLWLVNHVQFFDQNGEKFDSGITNLVVFKRLSASEANYGKPGWQIKIVSEMLD